MCILVMATEQQVLGQAQKKRYFLAGEMSFETRAAFSWAGLGESQCLWVPDEVLLFCVPHSAPEVNIFSPISMWIIQNRAGFMCTMSSLSPQDFASPVSWRYCQWFRAGRLCSFSIPNFCM